MCYERQGMRFTTQFIILEGFFPVHLFTKNPPTLLSETHLTSRLTVFLTCQVSKHIYWKEPFRSQDFMHPTHTGQTVSDWSCQVWEIEIVRSQYPGCGCVGQGLLLSQKGMALPWILINIAIEFDKQHEGYAQSQNNTTIFWNYTNGFSGELLFISLRS